MTRMQTRRQFIREMGISAAAVPLIWNLPSLAMADAPGRKQRLVIVFSPNGTLPEKFWPKEEGGDFSLGEIVRPLAPYQDRTLFLRGVSNRVRGDGDNHMRGMSCLLTGDRLFPGNIQGGSHTPAGWASGKSIDQEIANHFQSRSDARTRFGSLEFGVAVPHRADPWTRMVYAGPNKPVAPIDDPYQMFARLYGRVEDEASLKSVLDDVQADLKRVRRRVSAEDRKLLEEHEALVRKMEQDLKDDHHRDRPAPPQLEKGVKNENDNMPKLSRMQIDLLVSSFLGDATRVATLQYTKSVGQARMRWLGVDEGHHELSHHPDSNEASQEKLTKINRWYCEQLAYLLRRLDETPEPGGSGSLLDNTTVVWTNELGKGNNHTLNDIPFVLVGGGMGFRMGRSLTYERAPHNRLLMAFAHAVGHEIKSFGRPEYCGDGPLTGLV